MAVNSNNANFIGTKAGLNADNSYDSNFIGHNAGNGAHSYQSNFIGLGAGRAEKFGTNVRNSNFIGTFAGFDATDSYQSNFIGYQSGYQARNAPNSIFIGTNAGYADTVDNSNTGGWSILIGDNTNTGGFSNSIGLGAGAVNTASDQLYIADTITQLHLRGVNYFLPTADGAFGDVLTTDGSGNLTWAPGGSGGGSAWNLIGNAGTNPKDNFIGTIDAQDFVMKTSNIERARILSNGNVGINTPSPTATLEVKGSLDGFIGSIGPTTFDGKPEFLDDATIGGVYTGVDSCTIHVEIATTSPDNGLANDTFNWSYVSGPCSGASAFETEIIPGTPQVLGDGITVTFANGTGHTEKTGWNSDVSATLQSTDIFSVIGKGDENYLRITTNGTWNINNVLYQMPTLQASNAGDVLTNDGSGNLVWAAPGALTVNVTNGLQFIGGDVGLGGKLTQNTTIDGDANLNSLAFNELNLFGVGKTNVIEFGANERISLSSSDLITISAKNALTLNTEDGSLYIKTKNVNTTTAINGQVLTLMDASTGETEWQTISGGGSAGLQWYAENATAPTIAPIATGVRSIAIGDNAKALGEDMFVYGTNAGISAIADGSNFIGHSTGKNATNAYRSNFVGYGAGDTATNAANSNFFGQSSGYGATNAYNSNFFGFNAGYGATNAIRSNFIGQDAGNGATDASNSNFFGLGSGNSATNALRSNFFGMNSGVGAANAANSIFIGTNAGANDAVNNTATYDDAATFANTSILIGHNTSTGGFSNSIAFGAYATNTAANQLQIGSTSRFIRSVFIGDSKGTASVNDTFFVGRGAGSNATNASFSIFLGQGSGQNATSATGSSFIGRSAGSNATNASNSSFIGLNAGLNATGASSSNFMGRNAGSSASAASEATFIGNNAGRDATNAAYSTFLGTGAGFGAINARNSIIIGAGAGQDSVLNNTGNSLDYSIIIGNAATADGFSNSIALGAYATNTASNQFMIGSTTRTIDTTIWKGSASTTCTLTTGTGMACSSDERLKTNIIGLTTDTLDKLLNVKTVTYNWLQNPTSKTQIGFLAQDLEQYFPELVATDSNGMKSVYYSQMTPILVEAIREMNLKIITLNDMTQPNTWRDSLIAWMGNVENGIGQFVAGTIKARNQVCIDDVCMTKNQLRTLLENNGMHTTPTVSVSTPVVTDTTSAGDVSSNDTSGDNTVTDSVTTVDSSTGTGDVPPVGTE